MKKELTDHRHDSQLKAIAWVMSPNLSGYSILMPQYLRMFEYFCPSQVFAEEPQAISWALGMLPSTDFSRYSKSGAVLWNRCGEPTHCGSGI